MTFRHLLGLACAGLAAVTLAACSSGSPSSDPTNDTPTVAVCDESVFSGNIDVPMSAEASPMDEDAFPIADLAEAGVPLSCTAHLVVDYPEVDQTVDFDIAVTDSPIEEVTDALDKVIGTDGWERDADAPIWREAGKPTHYVQALEIDEGVLIGTTENG
jgi:hypothetical protein